MAGPGPAGNHPLPVSPKMPTVPGWLQLAASIGTPARLNAAAVRPVSPQALPAGVAATVFALARWVHAVPDLLPNTTPPPLVSAMTWPAGVAASASGAAARPGVSGPAGDQLVPPLLLAASGEKVRSWLGRNPVIIDPPPSPATTRPPLSATPGGVASRQRVVPACRTNSCQKLLCCAAGPPICTTAQPAPAAAANEVASGGAAGAAACPVLAVGELLQPAAITPAQASPLARAVTRRVAFMTISGLAWRHW